MFRKLRCYITNKEFSLNDLIDSKREEITLNIDSVSSIQPASNFGISNDRDTSQYSYRIIRMNNGDSICCIQNDADELERIIFKLQALNEIN